MISLPQNTNTPQILNTQKSLCDPPDSAALKDKKYSLLALQQTNAEKYVKLLQTNSEQVLLG